MAANRTTSPYNSKQSHELSNCPKDGITKLSWCPDPARFLLSCASWDKTVRVWSISPSVVSVSSQPVVAFEQEAPILDSCFTKDGRMLFAGGCENKVKAYDLSIGGSQQGQITATHDKPINSMRWLEQHNLLVTTSWDGHLRMWDGKTPTPVFDATLQKICAVDMNYPYLAVADVSGEISVWDLQKMGPQPGLKMPANLKLQIRDISLFANMQKPGFAIVEIAGRCGVQYFERKEPKEDFTFRCHRMPERGQMDSIYAVNSVDTNPKFNTLVTSGADGTIVFWDKDNKQRLKSFENVGAPIVDGKFHPEGTIFAYAISYDWHKGYDQPAMMNSQNKVLVHMMVEEDVRPRMRGR
eukprot:GHVS01077117.1.p1 GENE.GHVS01077117.1~~GHVS01077117.1.p1  ORF type:complete len:413 (+),score=61.70 GHVS01077117.1:178-1239(+)